MNSPQSSVRPASLEAILKKFQRVTDPKRRYEQLFWLAKRLPPFPESAKTPENKVPGCVSQVFVVAALVDGGVQFQADSDSQLTKGLVAFLVEGLNGLSPAEILRLTPDFIQETGLNVSLTPSRANGFYNIFKTMQLKTQALQAEAS
ncbi:SufE family protein [Synechococcales cyanobacterium C]|uniref:SufE family protein n=1 Tax=Petrachloros mirabilis ULC683 TaxID=2781853 RepID=A0A8K1ZZU3_9CYAN|nr:SufE family protein [Petrachloros mirabilis]NCJ06842.1 SufE family protein [Petrachloros mirabilis ULC683]